MLGSHPTGAPGGHDALEGLRIVFRVFLFMCLCQSLLLTGEGSADGGSCARHCATHPSRCNAKYGTPRDQRSRVIVGYV
jgi:hypothetical protein